VSRRAPRRSTTRRSSRPVQQRWNLPALTARDAAAPSFADVLTLRTPRTDDALAGVVVPMVAGQAPADGPHLQENQAELISRRYPAGAEPPPGYPAVPPARAEA